MRGRAIYTTGASPSGRPITARIGDGPPVAASLLACVQCHGEDGYGKSEGGVVPSDISWSALTRPHGVTRSDGRSRPPYSRALFARAVALGFDPAGEKLGATMPRYELSTEDLADLVAYLQELDDGPASPGVTADAVRIGLARDASPKAVAAVRACFNAVNLKGGVFRRRLDLITEVGMAGDTAFAFVDVSPQIPWPDPSARRRDQPP